MDCFLDFCLSCDKQTTDGLYCSQACRLADLEKAGSSTTPSPMATSASTFQHVSWSSPQLDLSSRFHLPPAVNFNTHKTSAPVSTETRAEEAYQVTLPSQTSSHPISPRGLTSSSSRSSLSSESESGVTPSGGAISEQARHELRDYFSAFDQTREMKRRSLSSISGH